MIQTILINIEFNKVIPEIPEVNINTCDVPEHVAQVERCIRVIEERCRACMSTMPFKKIPNIMTGTFLNFLVKYNVSENRNIISL